MENLINSNDYELAVKVINKYSESNSKDAEYYFMLAYCYSNLNMSYKAENIYSKSLEKGKDSTYALIRLGSIEYSKMNYHKAKEYLIKALKLNNKSTRYISYSWDEIQINDIYKMLLDIAIYERNKTDVVLYLSILNGLDYKISQNDMIKILNIEKGI